MTSTWSLGLWLGARGPDRPGSGVLMVPARWLGAARPPVTPDPLSCSVFSPRHPRFCLLMLWLSVHLSLPAATRGLGLVQSPPTAKFWAQTGGLQIFVTE